MLTRRSHAVLFSMLFAAPAVVGQTVYHHFNDAARYPRGGVVKYENAYYGVTEAGGPSYANGLVYRIDATTLAVSLPGIIQPSNGFIQSDLVVAGNALYGTAESGGSGNYGTVFKFDPATGAVTTVVAFDGSTNGANPKGRLTLSGSLLYGTTAFGGANGYGTVFSIDTASEDAFTTVASFDVSTFAPNGGLAASGSLLYGTSQGGGAFGQGTLYVIDTANNNSITTLASFNGTNGFNPVDGPTAIGTFLYGTASGGTYGRIYKFNTADNSLTALASFNGTNGSSPYGGLIASGSSLYGTTQYGGNVYRVNADTGAITTIATVGGFPSSRLFLDGNMLVGTTPSGGSGGQGKVFRLDSATATGDWTLLFSFNPFGDGIFPRFGLTASGQYLYGITLQGGAGGGAGSIFRFDPNTESIIDPWTSFSGSHNSYVPSVSLTASYPYGALIESGGSLFGTASGGGEFGYGSLYRVEPGTGSLTRVASFDNTNGANPQGSLLEYGGFLYGTARDGGGNSYGTVFKADPNGTTITALASFDGTNGQYPEAELVAYNGFLYGTTSEGGANGDGSVFKVNLTGPSLVSLASFNGSNGRYPRAGLVVYDGFLWGTTEEGGSNGRGTVFKIHPDTGAIITVLTFTGANGQYPLGPVIVSGSYLYGTTSDGTGNDGTVFKLNPASGAVGRLGTFDGYNGSSPACKLLQVGSLLYGTAYRGNFDGGVLFSVEMNALPSIVAGSAVARTEGAAPSSATIATVSDLEDAAGTLGVTASSIPSGISVTGFTNSGGTITATVGASCSAAIGVNEVTLQVQDSQGGTATVILTVSVTDGGLCLHPPQNLSATAMSATTVEVTWGAVPAANLGYRIDRTGGSVPVAFQVFGTSYTDSTVAANAAYKYTIVAMSSTEPESPPSNADYAAAIGFAGEAILPGSTTAKAVHVTELRSTINAIRALADLTAFSFTDSSLAGQALKAVHITELRTALNAARTEFGLPAWSFTNTLTPQSSLIRAVDLTEVRDAVK